ncbi:MAG TPA: phosphoribosylglycinamide formyltransferase [Acidobacteriota bacterium]|nr:phosphoribosylglycinamide formyltransferase [Acidobacteriota bacterium]
MNSSGRIAVLISGRGSNLKSLLDACAKGEIRARIALVISNKADAPGLQYARDAAIETAVLSHKQYPEREEYDAQIVEILKARQIDLVCLAGFMRLLSPVLIRAFPMRILNVHPALLPAFPGLHGQKQAVDYGVKVTGCTVHFVDEGLDSGPIILQNTIEVKPDDTEESLSARLLPMEHKTYAEAVRLFFENRLRVDGRKVTIL